MVKIKQAILLIIICIPLIIDGQPNLQTGVGVNRNGILFENGLSWDQIKAKAKKENKYIFIDCFATWCGPCKKMDNEIYANDTVGNYMNDKFISVRVQMDTSENDKEEVKKWYISAHSIQQENKVFAFPTYLFFSPDGKLLHKDLGFKNMYDFELLTSDALNPEKQYLTLLEIYLHGKKDYTKAPYLAKTANQFNDKDLALQIAKDYMHNYLDNLNEEEFCTNENLNFIATYLKGVSSNDRVFKLCYFNGDKINKMMGINDYGKSFTDYVIYQEEVLPYIEKFDKTDTDLDWDKIVKAIKKKVNNENTERIIINAKLKWYLSTHRRKMWPNQCVKYFVERTEKYGIDTTYMGLFYFGNSIEYSILRHCADSSIINKAIEWMEVVLRREPGYGYFYPYAGLLYKSGRVTEGLEWQKLVLDQFEYLGFKGRIDLSKSTEYKEQQENYEKMKRRENADKIWFDK